MNFVICWQWCAVFNRHTAVLGVVSGSVVRVVIVVVLLALSEFFFSLTIWLIVTNTHVEFVQFLRYVYHLGNKICCVGPLIG